MHDGRCPQALHRALKCRQSPLADFFEEDVERRLVELNDLGAGCFDFARLGVEQFCKAHGHVSAPTVVAVGERVADRHWPGKSNFQFLRGVPAHEGRVGHMHGPWPMQRSRDGGHVRFVAVVADAHARLARPVDAVETLEKAVHKVHAELLAVTDDVDAGRFLLTQPLQGGAFFRSLQFITREAPGRPEFLRFGEPVGFRQTADGRGGEHRAAS